MRRCIPLLALAVSAPGLSAQVFSQNTSDIPSSGSANNSWSENVDFGDVDLDGDWDAAFADGGDANNDQNRIWINEGGLQGGTVGQFNDQTSSRFPSINDDGRDVEFVDFDGDGDLDMYNSNTSAITNQTNRWWTNQGLAQGGNLGFYTDETQARWVGLGGSGSSVAPSIVLPGGGFIDWSCDCDFGDLDNDGDMDLVHSTYGGSFTGGAPTRIFLNDGDGFFTEFNPSGYQLSSDGLPSGAPALWAEGTQSSNTSNTTGNNADVSTSTLDIDLGDRDGDLDLDILHGDRNNSPRWFDNRLEENGGTLGFRDRTNAVYPSSVTSSHGGGNYEQELGDIDGDGDLDLYGLNWSGFTDRMYRNNGSSFGNTTSLSSSGADDNEGDFLDYDNDGDLDLFVANFSGTNKLYRNDDTGSGSIGFTFISSSSSGLSGTGSRNIDADACDVDNDGDYDVFVARDAGNANRYMENVTNTPDTHAPYLPTIESLGSNAASATPDVVRVQVYDNAPYYITWYNPTAMEVSVDGVDLPDFPMTSSGGQIFRVELPGNLLGPVSYRARSEDEYGNTGYSSTQNYTGTGASVGTSYGSSTNGSLGAPTLRALSRPFPNSPLYLAGENMPPGTVGFIGISAGQSVPGLDLSNGLLLNLKLPLILLAPGVADSNGDIVLSLGVPAALSGVSLYHQLFSLDGAGPNDFASSQGLEVVLL